MNTCGTPNIVCYNNDSRNVLAELDIPTDLEPMPEVVIIGKEHHFKVLDR